MIIAGLRAEPILETSTGLITPSDGAVVTFTGVTRADDNVVALVYEAWEETANKQLQQIAKDAQAKWNLSVVVAVHRTGRVSVGDAGVLCVAVAPHRDAAFEACRYLIDAIKETVTIWKLEEFTDGDTRWVGRPDA